MVSCTVEESVSPGSTFWVCFQQYTDYIVEMYSEALKYNYRFCRNCLQPIEQDELYDS